MRKFLLLLIVLLLGVMIMSCFFTSSRAKAGASECQVQLEDTEESEYPVASEYEEEEGYTKALTCFTDKKYRIPVLKPCLSHSEYVPSFNSRAQEEESCSWYCGEGPYKATATSALKPSGKNKYDADCANDFELGTAWVEGAPGQGIGESITYYFRNSAPRVTAVGFFNGYQKSKDTWQKNSRVKKFKVSVNGHPFAIIPLEDTWKEQWFELPDTLGHFDTKYCKKEQTYKEEPQEDYVWTLTFEIVSVYPGSKYEDTALSFIEFDGLDVHCLAEKSQILMADGRMKAVETLKANDRVQSMELTKGKVVTDVVKHVQRIVHDNIVNLTGLSADGSVCSLRLTDDHPVYVEGKGWCSVNPQKTAVAYPAFGKVGKLMVGDKVASCKGTLTLQSLKPETEPTPTYRIILQNGSNVIANGFVCGVESIE